MYPCLPALEYDNARKHMYIAITIYHHIPYSTISDRGVSNASVGGSSNTVSLSERESEAFFILFLIGRFRNELASQRMNEEIYLRHVLLMLFRMDNDLRFDWISPILISTTISRRNIKERISLDTLHKPKYRYNK